MQIVVATGFIAKTKTGQVTTLKRNGSDYSATIVGALFQSSRIIIWTDVDGVFSADPRKVPTSPARECQHSTFHISRLVTLKSSNTLLAQRVALQLVWQRSVPPVCRHHECSVNTGSPDPPAERGTWHSCLCTPLLCVWPA